MIKYRVFIQNIWLSLIVFGIGLTGLEIFAEKYIKAYKLIEKLNYGKNEKRGSPPIGCLDNELGWGYQPNTSSQQIASDFDVKYSINSKGFRDKEIALDKPDNVFRVIALGESTVFGTGVNYGKRFTEIIEDSLDNVEVINMGVQGYGVDQSLLQLKRYDWQFPPNVVVLFTVNDFLERCKYYFRLGQGAKPRFVLDPEKDGIILQDRQYAIRTFKIPPLEERQASSSETIRDGKKSLFWASNIFKLLYYMKNKRQIDQRMKNTDRAQWLRIHNNLAQGGHQIKEYNAEDFRKLIYFILQEYSSSCKTRGVDFIVVHIDTVDTLGLISICQELGIDFLELAQVLSRASKIRSLRFAVDPHYNDFTHKVIGEYVSDYIANKYGLQKNKAYIFEFFGKFAN